MWKKNELDSEPASAPPLETRPRTQTASPPQQQPVSSRSTTTATIGPSISIKGDISGGEDLVIEGRVEGAIQLRECDVTVGSNGRVTADIHGKRIYIDGEVTGDLVGDEVLIRKSGRVEGNAKAPTVTLENGCHFRGSIDMKPHNGSQKTGPLPSGGPKARPAVRA